MYSAFCLLNSAFCAYAARVCVSLSVSPPPTQKPTEKPNCMAVSVAPKGYASRAHLRRGEALQGRLIAQAFRTHTHDVDIVHHLHGSLAPRSLLKGYCSKAHPCTRAWRRGASGAPAFSTPSHAAGAPAFRTHSRGIDIVHRCAHLYSGASLRGVYRGVESAVVPRARAAWFGRGMHCYTARLMGRIMHQWNTTLAG